MKRLTFSFLLLIALFAAVADAQITGNSFKQKCRSSTAFATFGITSGGDVSINPCPAKQTLFTGSQTFQTGNLLFKNSDGNTLGQFNLSASPFFSFGNNLTSFNIDLSNNEIKADSASVLLGDLNSQQFGTRLEINDNFRLITLTASNGAAIAGNLAVSGTVNFNSNLLFARVVTFAGTVGNQTINAASGAVNIAAGGNSIVVTDNLVNSSSIIYATAMTNDSTCAVKNVVPAAGSFTIRTTANCTAETRFGFLVTN